MLKLKNILLAVCYLLFAYTNAQTNLVPNPSFENYITCPTLLGDYEASVWVVSSQTPDYFNSCATYTSCASIPWNGEGYQYAFDGQAYSGVYTLDYNVDADYREYLSAKLTTTLTVSTRYYFSMEIIRKASPYPNYGDCSAGNNGATDKIGALFTTNGYNDTTNPLNQRNYAHVYEHTIITDTANWTQVFGSFIADSAYQYINLGNFFDDNHTDTLYIYHQPAWGNPTACLAYYYIDKVILSTDSLFSLGITSYNYMEQKSILYPNPSTGGLVYSTINFNNDKVLVYDVLGNLVGQVRIANGNIINLSDLENGIYIIEVNNSQYQLKQKLIINKQ